MKEFIEKLIGRLEEEKECAKRRNAFDSELSYKSAILIVNQLAEEYNNGWISCSERLPEEQGWYLAHIEHCLNGLVTIEKVLWKKCKYGSWKFYRKGNDTKVIAWQPLPAPYQPKGE